MKNSNKFGFSLGLHYLCTQNDNGRQENIARNEP